MSVSMQDVRHALDELGKLRFGEMQVDEAMHQIVRTTHAIFNVDGAGLMQGLTAHAAYVQLRARARAERRKLALVSAEVVRQAMKTGGSPQV